MNDRVNELMENKRNVLKYHLTFKQYQKVMK